MEYTISYLFACCFIARKKSFLCVNKDITWDLKNEICSFFVNYFVLFYFNDKNGKELKKRTKRNDETTRKKKNDDDKTNRKANCAVSFCCCCCCCC